MKASVLASLLFSACAVAAPVDKRALVVKTEIVTETIVIFTTVYDDEPVPAATTTPQGLFFEVPTSSSVPAQQTSSSAPVNTPVQQPASPASSTPAPETSAAAVNTPTPAPQATQQQQQVAVASSEPVQQAAPTTTTTPVAAAPAAAATSAPAAQQQSSTSSSTTGQTYSGDITIYDNDGNKGACGTALYDSDMVVALNQATWGQSTYDVMTGAATNPWCGQKIRITYKSTSIDATIMDLCPGCSGSGDIDLSLAAWKALTGLDEKTRLQASWQKIA